jgi:hypothetical protein
VAPSAPGAPAGPDPKPLDIVTLFFATWFNATTLVVESPATIDTFMTSPLVLDTFKIDG